MPIPELQFGLLPVGIHSATLEEVKEKFAKSELREKLWNGFENFILWVKEMDAFEKIYLAGGFVTDKPEPVDVDIVLSFCTAPDLKKLDPKICDKEYVRTTYGVDATLLEPPKTIELNLKPKDGFAISFSVQVKPQKKEKERVLVELKRIREANGAYDMKTFAGEISNYQKGLIVVTL